MSRIMKIALLTNGIHPIVVGGMQRHSYYLCKYLAQNQISIDLYHSDKGQSSAYKLSDLFTAKEMEYIQEIFIPYPKQKKYPGHYLKESMAYSEKMLDEFKQREAVDFIYAKGLCAWAFLKEKDRLGTNFPPIGVKAHGYEMFQPPPNYRSSLEQYLLRPPFKYNSTKADVVFSYGGKITEILLNKIHIPAKNIIEIPTGISSSWLRDTPVNTTSKRQLVYLGRFERRKGIQELSASLGKLGAKAQFNFTHIGPVSEEQKLSFEHIHYTGLIKDSTKIRKILTEADALVCPSHSEGMPNVIMEAMASGCAIIATDVGAVAEMVDRSNGWLIPPRDTAALENALNEFQEISEEDLIRKRQSSIDKVRQAFLWEEIAKRTIHNIQERLPAYERISK